MKFKIKFLANFSLGILIGGIFVSIFGILTDTTFQTTLSHEISNALTLAGVLATACLTLAGVLATIENQNNLDKKARTARLAAARATLPIALSELHAICANHIQFCIDCNPERKKRNWVESGQIISTIKECIEFSDGAPRETLKEIPSIYQIMIARDRTRDQGEVEDTSIPLLDPSLAPVWKYARAIRIAEWSSFLAVIESMFDFARGRADSPKRDLAVQSFWIHLDHLSENGRMIVNDEIVRKAFERIKEMPDFAFNNPNWVLTQP